MVPSSPSPQCIGGRDSSWFDSITSKWCVGLPLLVCRVSFLVSQDLIYSGRCLGYHDVPGAVCLGEVITFIFSSSMDGFRGTVFMHLYLDIYAVFTD